MSTKSKVMLKLKSTPIFAVLFSAILVISLHSCTDDEVNNSSPLVGEYNDSNDSIWVDPPPPYEPCYPTEPKENM